MSIAISLQVILPLRSGPVHVRVSVLIPPFTRRSGVVRPGESAIMDVRGWLRSLGLGQYEERFRANKIDLDELADLTAATSRNSGSPSATVDGCSGQ